MVEGTQFKFEICERDFAYKSDLLHHKKKVQKSMISINDFNCWFYHEPKIVKKSENIGVNVNERCHRKII